MIETVQEVTELPLCIDSPNPAVIEAVLPLVKKRPMINSMTLGSGRMEEVLRLVVDQATKVIDPTDSKLSAVIIAGRLISGRETCSMNYIRAFREGRLE